MSLPLTFDLTYYHLPVMSREVVRFLNCKPGGLYVDGTLGGGGHTKEILKASDPEGKVIGIDWDEEALLASKSALKDHLSRVTMVQDNFANIKMILASLHITTVDGILLDLGVSSYHLERPERGFSFRFNTPLDMRMDRRKKWSAYHLVNELTEKELEGILWEYGEERWARRIARAVVKVRKGHPITTTGELAGLVSSSIPKRFHPRGIHPATRTFQALRIAVNEELENLRKAIGDGIDVLSRGGRMVIISFHSLEDRIVKRSFRSMERGCICPPGIPRCVCGREPLAKVITHRPITPTPEEVSSNPRARGARLRALERL